MKKLFIISLLLVFTVFFLFGVNIAQNGVGGWDGRTIEELLGMSAAEAGLEEIASLTKAEIIQQGTKLGVDYSLTVSCYQADESGRACGRCDSCRIRKEGFGAAGVPDPTRYA